MLTLREAVAQVESSGRTSAIRFEPRWKPLHQQEFIKQNGWVDTLTADTFLQTSFGKYQVMCDNLYGMIGYQKPINVFYANEAEQDDVFQQFAIKIGFGAYTTTLVNEVPNLDSFALRYNGSVVYANSLLKA